MIGSRRSWHGAGIGSGNVATARFLQSPQWLPKDVRDIWALGFGYSLCIRLIDASCWLICSREPKVGLKQAARERGGCSWRSLKEWVIVLFLLLHILSHSYQDESSHCVFFEDTVCCKLLSSRIFLWEILHFDLPPLLAPIEVLSVFYIHVILLYQISCFVFSSVKMFGLISAKILLRNLPVPVISRLCINLSMTRKDIRCELQTWTDKCAYFCR